MPKPPRKPPSVVQLPGGIRLDGIPFKITARDELGRPKTFEVQAAFEKEPTDDDAILWADLEFIRKPRW